MTKKLNSLSSALLIAYYNNQSLETRKVLRRFIGPRQSTKQTSETIKLETTYN